MNKVATLVFIALLSSAVSYRIVDFQNDEAELEATSIEPNSKKTIENPVSIYTGGPEGSRTSLTDLIEEKPSPELNLLISIQESVTSLKSSNEKLKNELKKTQNELSYQRKIQNRPQKPANIQLTTKYEEETSEGFWQWVWRFSKPFVGSILRFFGLRV